MSTLKGPVLEELVRAYFAQQGYFAVRSASYRFGGSEVTDIDVWLYGRQGAGARVRAIVDVKNKRSPKALERIVWARGMQDVLGADLAIVATTDTDPNVARFARGANVSLLTKPFLTRLEQGLGIASRLSLEEFVALVRANPSAKMDGDWVKIIESVRSVLISTPGFGAFNQATVAFRFFAQKVATRTQHFDQVLRCAYLVAAYSCIALDHALSGLAYDSADSKKTAIVTGVRFGSDDFDRVQSSMRSMLDVVASRMENGRVVAAQASQALNDAFGSVRAEIIGEFFGRDVQPVNLFKVAKELEKRAFSRVLDAELSLDEKQVLGVLCDFLDVPRAVVSFGRARSGGQLERPTRPADGAGRSEAAPEIELLPGGNASATQNDGEGEPGSTRQEGTQDSLL